MYRRHIARATKGDISGNRTPSMAETTDETTRDGLGGSANALYKPFEDLVLDSERF